MDFDQASKRAAAQNNDAGTLAHSFVAVDPFLAEELKDASSSPVLSWYSVWSPGLGPLSWSYSIRNH